MLLLTGVVSPAAIAGTTTDWAPTGGAAANTIRISLSAAATLTSLTGGVSGRLVVLQNISTLYALTILNDDGATGTAANRFLTPGNVVVPPLGAARAKYDGISLRWRLTGEVVASSGSDYGFLLNNDPVDVNTTYTITRNGNLVTQELWVRTSGATNYKSIDYTYSGDLVATEVRKVYDSAGAVVVAQLTITYAYLANVVTGATYTRNV